jgi:hypothetical protein
MTGAYTRLNQGGQTVYPQIAPQVFGNVHLGYWLGPSLPSVTLAAYGMGPRLADRTTPTGATLPEAPSLADLRLAIVGRFPLLRAIGYSLTGDYTTASMGPYTAGPSFQSFQSNLIQTGAMLPTAGFAPVDQFRVMLGLRFDFLNGGSTGGGESQ